VYGWYREGRFDLIAEYAPDDAKKALQLYEKVAPVFLD
jgi:hypothetical protein